MRGSPLPEECVIQFAGFRFGERDEWATLVAAPFGFTTMRYGDDAMLPARKSLDRIVGQFLIEMRQDVMPAFVCESSV